MARIYVGGLAGAVKPEEIAESFARAGAVVEGVELMRDADGRSKGFAYVQVADTEGAEKCIKLYNRTAWRGGRLRVEHASESYMARLEREWAERDGRGVVAAAVAPAPSLREEQEREDGGSGGGGGGGGGVQKEDGDEGKRPRQERDKRYLRLRRKAGEKALVVDTLPVLLKARDVVKAKAKEKEGGGDGKGGGSKKRPRRRAAKLLDFSAGASAGGREKSLKEIWAGAFGPLEALEAVVAPSPLKAQRTKKERKKEQRRVEEDEEEEEQKQQQQGVGEGEREGDVAALLEAGEEEGELDFAWGDEEEGGGQEGEGEVSSSSSGGGEEEDAEEMEEAASEQEEEEEDALAKQLREEEERNRRILSGILGGLGLASGDAATEAAAGGAGQSQPSVVLAARRERAPQALVAVPRFDPTSEEAGMGALMPVDDEGEGEGEEGGSAAAAAVGVGGGGGGGASGGPPAPGGEAVAAADVGALTDIYRTFRPGEGEEAVPLGAQDAVVPFSFGFGFGPGLGGAGAGVAGVAPGAAADVGDGEVEAEAEEVAVGVEVGVEVGGAPEPPKTTTTSSSKPLDWRSPEMVSVLWPALGELEARARAFVAGASRRVRGERGEEGGAAGGGGGGGFVGGQQQQQRWGGGGAQPRVDEGWRRERHKLMQDSKRKRRNAVKSNHTHRRPRK